MSHSSQESSPQAACLGIQPLHDSPTNTLYPLDGCDVGRNLGEETQLFLDWPFSSQNLWKNASTALRNAGLYTPRDVLVAGAKYVRSTRSIGPRAWREITTESPVVSTEIEFVADPTPEHIAHFCPSLAGVSAAALLARVVRFNTEYQATNPELKALDIITRSVEPEDIRGLFVRPTCVHTQMYRTAKATSRLSDTARQDEHLVSFYHAYGGKIDRFVERFNRTQRQISELL